MNIIKKINTIPLTTFFLFSIVIGLLSLIPVSLILVSQQTKLPSSAAPHPTPIPLIRPKGPIPSEQPRITSLEPFVGKVGDVIVIRGENLGDNPKESWLTFPQNHRSTDKDILSWQNNLIESRIPKGSTSGYLFLTIGPWQIKWPVPLTIYTPSTSTKLSYRNFKLSLTSLRLFNIQKVIIWQTKNNKTETTVDNLSNLVLERPPLGVALVDNQDRFVTFYIDPTEFGF